MNCDSVAGTSTRENAYMGIVDLEHEDGHDCRLELDKDRTLQCNWDAVDKVGRGSLGGGGHEEEQCKELCAPAPWPPCGVLVRTLKAWRAISRPFGGFSACRQFSAIAGFSLVFSPGHMD